MRCRRCPRSRASSSRRRRRRPRGSRRPTPRHPSKRTSGPRSEENVNAGPTRVDVFVGMVEGREQAMTRNQGSRERGAVLLHVAVAMLGLLAFCALVVDYGIFWAARRQAQNSADAGALAGAMGLAYDDPTDFSDTG